MRSWSVNPLIIRSALLIVTFAYAVALPSVYTFRNRGCAEHCLGGCHSRGPGKCDRSCKPNYSLQRWSGKCIPKCGEGCASCIRVKATSYNHCRMCQLGYKLRIRRKTGETFCQSRRSTPICDPNCAGGCSAQSDGKCDKQCNANFLLNTNYQCAACDVHCLPKSPGDCLSPGTCMTECIQGFAIEPAIQQCVACGPSCTGGCGTKGPGFCDGQCDADTVFVEPDNICQPCDPHCADGCTEAGFCNSRCDSGYGITPINHCAPCDEHCASECVSKGAGYCDSSCDPGFVLSLNDYTCVQCQPAPGCKADVRCGAPGECTADKCEPGFTFNSVLKTCN